MALQGATSARDLRDLKNEKSAQGSLPALPKFFMEMASTMGADPKELWVVLKATAFKGSKVNGQVVPPTDEQMYALMMVANSYGLNPFTKEIYAFPDKQNGIVPVIGVDGWLRLANSNPMMDGYEMRASDNVISIDKEAKPCPEWMEGVVYRKDRSHPVVVREYLDECYRPAFRGNNGPISGPWQSHTKRMLRHKALIQALRTAFGFAGVYEEDEAHRILGTTEINITPIPENIPDTSAFDEMAGDMLSDAQFMQFVTETARASNCTVDALKVEAAKHWDGFVAAFQSWAKKSLDAAPITIDLPAQQDAEKVQAAPKEAAKEQAAKPAGAATVTCPRETEIEGKPTKVFASACESCDIRPTCPAH